MSFSHLVKKLKTSKINEAMIINEILKNSKQILEDEVKQKHIAENIYISHSTISRLIVKLGYKNWNDFVASCKVEEVFFEKSSGGIQEKMYIQSSHINNWWKENVNLNEQVIKKMKKSKLLVFFGERVSGNIAQNISFLMSWKNIMTTHYFFEQEMKTILGNGVTLVILTSTLRTNFQNIINFASNKGVEVIVVDSSAEEFDYKNAIHIKIPLISYVDDEALLYYLKSESLRHYLVRVYENL